VDKIREKGEWIAELIDHNTTTSDKNVARVASWIARLTDELSRLNLREFMHESGEADEAGIVFYSDGDICGRNYSFRSAIESFVERCVDPSLKKKNAFLKRVRRSQKLISRIGDC